MNISIHDALKNFEIDPGELHLYGVKDLKKKYHKLCLKYHPDKCKNCKIDRFLEIKHSYEILLNEIICDTQTRDKNRNNENDFFNFMSDIFTNENVEYILSLIKSLKNTLNEEVKIINYHVSLSQVVNKEVFYNKEFKVYVPLWFKCITLNDILGSKSIYSGTNVLFVIKINPEENIPFQISDKNDIVFYIDSSHYSVNEVVKIKVNDKKEYSFVLTNDIIKKKYHIQFNIGIPRLDQENIYDFEMLSNVIYVIR